jgi:4-amino-4-deoxy-L-arabinose transferase-like glycosyltransferase
MNWRGAVIAALFCSLAVLASHATILGTPYFWDEAGQFIPAARDIAAHGRWIPESTLPNVHPPLVPAWIALCWRVFGDSIPATRIAMLVLASLALAAAYGLARELAGAEAAIWAAVLLALSPLFYAQSMLAQLDLPAMLWTSLALLLFLRGWHASAAVACCLLVLTKETGAVLPVWCALWLAWRKEWKPALYYVAPLAALGGWLFLLQQSTGHWTGNAEFADYNLRYPLHPVRLALALARRVWYLGVDNMHWVGVVAALVAWKAGVYYRSHWRFVAGFAVLQTLAVSVLGGASLERYLLPVMPVLFAAFAAALLELHVLWRTVFTTALAGGLICGHLLNPLFYPFPYENNQAFLDFTRLHRDAAELLEREAPGQRVLAAWPMSAELAEPFLGYVRRPLRTVEAKRQDVLTLAGHAPSTFDAVVLFSKDFEPAWFPLRDSEWGRRIGRAIGYHEPATREWVEGQFAMRRAARFERRGQWVEVYLRRR